MLKEVFIMGTKKEFTIERNDGSWEPTVVGTDGQTHIVDADEEGKNGHFTNEGEYRRAIENAMKENSR